MANQVKREAGGRSILLPHRRLFRGVTTVRWRRRVALLIRFALRAPRSALRALRLEQSQDRLLRLARELQRHDTKLLAGLQRQHVGAFLINLRRTT